MKTIFENGKQINKIDILNQIGLGICFIVITLAISKFRFINRYLNNESFWIMGLGLLILFGYLNLNATTIKRIEKQQSENKLIFTFSRQLRKDRIKELNLAEINLNLKTIPGRSLPHKKILLISDKKNKIKISTRQKGITVAELDKIIYELKGTTHNNRYK